MRVRVLIFCICVLAAGAALLSQDLRVDPEAEILLDRSSKYVGAERPHELGYTGKGVRVAVIDTGVDYSHPDLFGFGSDAKVVGGYDFVENDQSPTDTNGHGTEVAGIIAANGSLRGIAPDAKILAYRVSDTGNSVSSDLIVSAIKRAVEDGVDIINISLGVNRTNDRIDEAINEATEKGIVVVVAAGNSGPDIRTIGSPGRDPHAITVGATYNNITESLVATLQVDGKRIEVLPMVGMPSASQSITGEIVFGKYGRVHDLEGIDAKGKILLVERGSDQKDELVYFSEKERNAASAGASAVIVYNNEPGIFLGDLRSRQEGPDYTPRIPTVSMSKEDGLELKSMLQNRTVGTINTFYHPDFVSFFSSRGPVSPFYIKPDLVAPGVFVNSTSINGAYNLTSGTSFAAPHVSGAVALLLQRSPSLTPQQVASIIITTTDPVSDTFETAFPHEVSGAGRLNVTRAFGANLVISPHYAVFDLSPFSKSKTVALAVDSLDGSAPNISASFDFDYSVADIEYSVKGNAVNVRASLQEQASGQYQGTVIISDGASTYRVPMLVRVSDASVDVLEDGGVLSFKIDSLHDWSYAKVSAFNSDARLVGSTSITPVKQDTIPVYEAGQYWVETDLRTQNGTYSTYSTVTVKSPAPRPLLGIDGIWLAEEPLLIISAIVAVTVLVGVALRRS